MNDGRVKIIADNVPTTRQRGIYLVPRSVVDGIMRANAISEQGVLRYIGLALGGSGTGCSVANLVIKPDSFFEGKAASELDRFCIGELAGGEE